MKKTLLKLATIIRTASLLTTVSILGCRVGLPGYDETVGTSWDTFNALRFPSIDVEWVWQNTDWPKQPKGLCLPAAIESWHRWEWRNSARMSGTPMPKLTVDYQFHFPESFSYIGDYAKPDWYYSKFDIYEKTPVVTVGTPWPPLVWRGTFAGYGNFLKNNPQILNNIPLKFTNSSYLHIMKAQWDNLYETPVPTGFVSGENIPVRRDASPMLLGGAGGNIGEPPSGPVSGLLTLGHAVLVTGIHWDFTSGHDRPLAVSILDPNSLPLQGGGTYIKQQTWKVPAPLAFRQVIPSDALHLWAAWYADIKSDPADFFLPSCFAILRSRDTEAINKVPNNLWNGNLVFQGVSDAIEKAGK